MCVHAGVRTWHLPPGSLHRGAMSRILDFLRQWARQPAVREFAAWCLPALVLGLVLRAMLMAQLPHAFYHDDSPDILTTPDSLLFKHRWELHTKKTFLVPLLYCVPFVLHINAGFLIPLAQHLLGLSLVVVVGWLCRLWFICWRWFIIPITVLVAANPFLLWFEHCLMPESTYVFCTALLALAGTLYTRERSRERFIFLCVALALEAGARPEGKLLFGFALFLLVLLHACDWRVTWRRMAVVAVLGIVLHFVTKTSQAGLLLYTSVARLTPTDLKCAPGLDPYIAPIREHLQQRWNDRQAFPKVTDRSQVADAVRQYLLEHPGLLEVKRHRSVNQFCTKLAMETCRRNLSQLPALAYYKFRETATLMPSGLFDRDWLFDFQHDAYFGSLERLYRLSKILTGTSIKTEHDLDEFVKVHYQEVPWFNVLANRWLDTANSWRLPDQMIRVRADKITFPVTHQGIPCYFVVAGVGVLAVMLRRGPLQPFHIAWGLSLLGLFFVIILTANVKPRFRLVFEPFWFIYIGLLLDTMIAAVRALVMRPKASTKPEPRPMEVQA
jgi:hypothetical protein